MIFFDRTPVFVIRGICDYSQFDNHYGWTGELSDGEKYNFRGFFFVFINRAVVTQIEMALYCLVHNCTIFLCALDVRNIDDQCRGPSIKERDHLAG